jgi:hypothetical protein
VLQEKLPRAFATLSTAVVKNNFSHEGPPSKVKDFSILAKDSFVIQSIKDRI